MSQTALGHSVFASVVFGPLPLLVMLHHLDPFGIVIVGPGSQ